MDPAGKAEAKTIEELFKETGLPAPNRIILPEEKDLAEFLRGAGKYKFI